ncbi:MAG TPA: DUF2207 domain-containing protein [Candidatus Saccharimonadia bacterium]
MTIRTLRFVAVLLFGGLFLAPAAHAEVVTDWQSAVTLNSDGSATVRETIHYNPEDASHHGIIREIPGALAGIDGSSYFYAVKLQSVTDARGASLPLAENRQNRRGLYLKIGSSGTYLDAGDHTYVITYTLKPVVTRTANADRLSLNIIGPNWRVPVQTASATITLPRNVSPASLACYTGSGTTHDCTITQTAPNTISLSTDRPLDAYAAFTADLSLPSLGLGAYLEADKPLPFSTLERLTLALLGLALLVVMAGGGWLVWRWLRQWQARRRQTIIAIYEAPAGLSPAHMSVLESPAADVADITATLIHLAVRGFLKIEQTKAKTWYRQASYRLTRLPQAGQLAPFENTLVDAIFLGAATVDLDNLATKRPHLSEAIRQFRRMIGQDLANAKYFWVSPTGWLGGARAVAGLAAAILAVVVGAIVASGESNSELGMAGLAALSLGLAAVFLALCRRASGRTATGNQQWAHIRGFKWFLEVTEKDRLNFTDAPEKTPELFSKMLPYAIALKVEKQWAKQFAGIDVSPAVGGWYVGYVAGSFSADAFTGSFSSSFGGAMSSGFSGAAGGGAAGGGVGGGGGGGW